MKTKEYFEKVMQNYNQNRKGRSLVSIVQMKELITSGWLSIREIIVPVRTILVGWTVFQGVFEVKNDRFALFHQIIC